MTIPGLSRCTGTSSHKLTGRFFTQPQIKWLLADVLYFLQELLDKGRPFSTVKVYLAAVSECHVGIDRNTIGQHPLICIFMRGAWHFNRVSKPLILPWDLSVVFNASQSPFEPVDIDLKFLSLKADLLLAFSTSSAL